MYVCIYLSHPSVITHRSLSLSLMALTRPQMLKDFLAEDPNPWPSSGFRSSHRKGGALSMKLTRSRSKAASTTISVIHRASEIFFKYFNSVKSPSAFPRSVSRRRPSGRNDVVGEVTTVKVKDILRWRSFRDLVDEEIPPAPLDFSSSPPRCTTTNASTTDCPSTSGNSSSWCDSDFTAEDLPFWRGNSDEFSEMKVGKTSLPVESVGRDSTLDHKGELSSSEEKEQNSPVSVLNFPFQEDEDSFLSFHPNLANLQRRKQLAMIEPSNLEDQFNSLDEKCLAVEEDSEREEKARLLLNRAKAGEAMKVGGDDEEDQLLLDFFSYELATDNNTVNGEDDQFDGEILLRAAKAWMSRRYEEEFEWEIEGKRVAYVRDMERGARWSNFQEGQQELTVELETRVLDNLVDELLVDLIFPQRSVECA